MTAIPPVDGLTIGAALRLAAARRPDHEALVISQGGFRATYAGLDARVDDIARALLALDVRRGDHVAVWTTNWPEWTLAFLAATRIGAVLVTVNPAYRTHELAYVLNQSETKVLFLVDRFKSSDYFAMIAQVRRELPLLRSVVSMKEHAPEGALPWSGFLAMGSDISASEVSRREALVAPLDPSTGRIKDMIIRGGRTCIRASAKRSASGSSCARARTRRRTNSARSARSAWRTSRCPGT